MHVQVCVIGNEREVVDVYMGERFDLRMIGQVWE